MKLIQKTVATPLGEMRLVASEAGLVGVCLPGDGGLRAEPGTSAVLEQGARELAEYFAGARTTFSTPLAPAGTEFQQKVWSALREIPFGERRSYGWLAGRIGQPLAARAVGAANGRNPIAIMVPCHRVIGADGSLTGYGGGLDAKQWLLIHEAGGRPSPIP